MYLSLIHNEKTVKLDLGKPVRVKLGDWADFEEGVWRFAQVDLCVDLTEERPEVLFLTLTRENEKGEDQGDRGFETGDCISLVDVEEIFSNTEL